MIKHHTSQLSLFMQNILTDFLGKGWGWVGALEVGLSEISHLQGMEENILIQFKSVVLFMAFCRMNRT